MPGDNGLPAVLLEDYVRGGSAWSHVLKRGTTLRIIDVEGGANVGALFFNFEIPSERYNMPDTLKAQHTARLTKGFVLYSDMGRVLCSITDDTCGWHDPIGGASTSASMSAKFGEGSYQRLCNDFHRNAQDNFLIELQKYGLTLRDLPINVNFFSKVSVQEDGSLNFQANHSQPGSYVDLRAEMNTLVILDTCQHLLDPGAEYRPRPVKLVVTRNSAPGPDDLCRNHCPENQRGFLNTEAYFA